ncbi:MAG TPA: M23 family metallopeptidase [Clostridia bacterium]|nr:M23 family metallopeptidase [Clostridia bacterium]
MPKFKSIIFNTIRFVKTFFTGSAKVIKPIAAFVYNVLSKSTVILSYIIKKSWAASLIIFFSLIDAVVYLNEINVIIDQMISSFFYSSFFVFYKFIEFICKKVTDSIVWVFNLLRRWKREKFTFVIISHENSKQKDFSLSKLFVYSGTLAVSFSALFLAISSFVLFNINEDLTNEVFSSREKTNNLMAVNKSYEEQIDSLKNNAVIVSEKLDELNVLEYKIRDMVGLKLSEKESTSSDLAKPLSRSADRTVNIPENNNIYVPEDSNEIIDLIEDEKHTIDKFSKDLEIRLDFLDARPDLMPATGRLTSPFGFRTHPITGKKDYHKGIDIANNQGTKIFASGSGVVTYVGYNSGYGRMVIISHGYGYKSVYAHLKSASVKTGDSINKGDLIALMGSTGISTGSHLHFEIHYNGKQINPLNVIEN